MALPTGVKAGVHIKRSDATDTAYEPLRARDPVAIVIFGASGDLSKRKLIPALYELHVAGKGGGNAEKTSRACGFRRRIPQPSDHGSRASAD